jgi:hypothetical protein
MGPGALRDLEGGCWHTTINLHIETFHHFILTFIIVTLIWMYSRNNLTNIRQMKPKHDLFLNL